MEFVFLRLSRTLHMEQTIAMVLSMASLVNVLFPSNAIGSSEAQLEKQTPSFSYNLPYYICFVSPYAGWSFIFRPP